MYSHDGDDDVDDDDDENCQKVSTGSVRWWFLIKRKEDW
jgi:hypothetical protein